MKHLYILFTLALLVYGCDKNDTEPESSECSINMKNRFDSELKCTTAGFMEVNLYSGFYNDKAVFFPMIMCPSCGTLPPKYGYTCEDEKITFENFSNVTDIKEVYNSCTKKFANHE